MSSSITIPKLVLSRETVFAVSAGQAMAGDCMDSISVHCAPYCTLSQCTELPYTNGTHCGTVCQGCNDQ